MNDFIPWAVGAGDWSRFVAGLVFFDGLLFGEGVDVFGGAEVDAEPAVGLLSPWPRVASSAPSTSTTTRTAANAPSSSLFDVAGRLGPGDVAAVRVSAACGGVGASTRVSSS